MGLWSRRHGGVGSPLLPPRGEDGKVVQGGDVDGRHGEDLHLPAEEGQRLVAFRQVQGADGAFKDAVLREPANGD